MKRGSLILAILAVLITASCSRTVPAGRNELPLVCEIIQDSDNPYHKIIAASTVPDPAGSIYILGEEEAVMRMAEDMAVCDKRDNIDGSLKADGLPDFAGETICCVVDTTGNFRRLIAEARSGNDVPLRETMVKSVVGLIDTVCHVGPYDVEGLGSKQSAKLIILAAPRISLYAKQDVDTLLSSLNSAVRVISPAEEMFDVVFSSHKGHDVSMGAIYDDAFEGTVYEELFLMAARRSGSLASSFACIPAGSSVDSTLVSFVDSFIAKGNTRPLNSIVIDSYDVNLEDMKTSLAGLISVMNEESVKYGKYFAKDFRFLHTSDAVTSRCYELLRTNNIFTHNIAKPQIEVFHTAVSPEDGKSIFLVPGTYVQN